MSSTYSGAYSAAMCIDDNLINFCHSVENVANPWISVALSSAGPIMDVVVYNRNSNQDRLSPYEVWVGDSAGSTAGTLCGGAVQTAPATNGPFTTSCAGASGSFVTILLPGASRTLNLAEVYVVAQ